MARCQTAALRGDLLFKVDVSEGLSFCDASYPDGHELHEISYWHLSEFTREPGLFEGVLKTAVTLDARFMDVVHTDRHGRHQRSPV